jgi:hypothetical protein
MVDGFTNSTPSYLGLFEFDVPPTIIRRGYFVRND